MKKKKKRDPEETKKSILDIFKGITFVSSVVCVIIATVTHSVIMIYVSIALWLIVFKLSQY